jgi:hypothetical protein
VGPPDHDCVEVINEVFSRNPDLCDQPLAQPDLSCSQIGAVSLKKEKGILVMQ